MLRTKFALLRKCRISYLRNAIRMPRRPAHFTQADVARAVRAAKQAGADHVEVRPDGTILVKLSPDNPSQRPAPLEPEREIVL
jgi:hypothetical protein